ncbi:MULTISPECIES: hypothetical protein [Acetobacter]|uniref:Uncharacterized protein n=2 Tax=Acetobacter TaxID=434 RepID=A0ABT1EQE9_9PROT|nr:MULTISPECIES: hypothetical protein [Acetobacter]KFL90276.1 hypothetical protein AmDm5_1132 [Acetobacter malorum]MCP1245599.1 hypothetical protein [Acetobacter cerevisiae]MCP1255255.1 hypothetical protein [Acetobacter cerevisiae]MCP1269750.1 hypothetical protein [Acetobacter cerevisiae]MCP1277704.1 hypothetical protein [Acetobacter cerevisiae]
MRYESKGGEPRRQVLSGPGSRARLQGRVAHAVATCAMGSWFLLGLIPVLVIIYSMS